MTLSNEIEAYDMDHGLNTNLKYTLNTNTGKFHGSVRVCFSIMALCILCF
jgi:hypothetical protein